MRQNRRCVLRVYAADGRTEETEGEKKTMFGFSKGKIKTTLTITDMQCSMCEAHINDAVRKAFKVNSVKSSAGKHETVIWSDEELPEEQIRAVIKETGYTLTSITSNKQ